MAEYNCELCDMINDVTDKESNGHHVYYTNESFIFMDCPICDIPIIVYRKHSSDPNEDQLMIMRDMVQKIWNKCTIKYGRPHRGVHYYRHIYIGG
jgi:hypothetical protein